MKKLLSLFVVLCLACCLFAIPASAQQILYQGYHEFIDVNGYPRRIALRIKDGYENDGNDKIAYCYDLDYKYPTIENPNLYEGNDDRCYYSRIDSYLDSFDELTLKYGYEVKQKIAMALYAGYPIDAFGHYERSGITENEARFMMQRMVWDLTHGECKPYVPEDIISGSMANYYNSIYKDCLENFEENNVFHSGYCYIEGSFQIHIIKMKKYGELM